MKMRLLCSALLILSVELLNAQNFIADSVSLQAVEIRAIRQSEQSPASHQKLLDSTMLSQPSSGNLGKVISDNTAIFVKTYGQGALATVSFRGSGASHTGVYWNGFQLNSAMNGMVDLSLLPIAFYDQVEIDYGNSSIEKGAGGLGGSIDLINLADFSNRLSVDFHQSIGSYGHIGTYSSVKSGNEKWQFNTRVYRQSAENDFEYKNLGREGFPMEKQENASFLQHGLLQSIFFRPNPSSLLKMQAWYVNSDREIPSIMTVNNKDEFQEDESLRVLASITKYMGKGKMEFASNYQHEFLEYSNKLLEQHSISTTNSWKNLIKTEHDFSSRFKMSSRLHLDMQTIDNKVYNTSKNQWRQAAYLAGVYRISNMNIELFAREEWMTDRRVYFLPGAAINYSFGEEKNWILSSSIAKNMKYPSLNDLYWLPAGNPNLKPEESTNLEVRLSSSMKLNENMISSLSFTAFRYNIQNYIQWQPTAFGYWRAQNLKVVESEGVELEGLLNWKHNANHINLSGSYSYTQSINTKALQEDDESVGKQLFYVPEHLWNIRLELKRNDYWLKISQHYTGVRYTTSDNSEFLSAFSLLAVKAGKSWLMNGHKWHFEVGIDNLLNESYQAIQWRPMPGRNYIASIKYHFEQ